MKAILTYHSIDESGSPISMPAASFEAHRQWFERRRVAVLPLDQLIAHPADGPDAVAVTFDDGFLNNKAPLERLLGAGIPATLFVVSGHVGGTNAWGGHPQLGIPTLPLLDWPDLKDLKSRGASIEAHTNTHANLPRLTPSEVDAELMQCRTALRERLGVESAHLAYPYGALNGGVVAHAARVFRYGYTTEFRVLQNDAPSMQIPRLDMYYFQAPDALENWGSRAFAWRLATIRARRSIRARILPG